MIKFQYTPRHVLLLVLAVLVAFVTAATTLSVRAEHDALSPGAGMLLVAAPQMRDPRFKQSVILLTEHSREGSLGIIINMKTDLPVAQALPELEQLAGSEHVMFFGGPVQPERVMYVYTDAPGATGDEIITGVYWGKAYDLLKDLVTARAPDSLRIFFGYAGWGPGQLGFELSLHDWKLLPARTEHIFTTDSDKLWPLLNRPTTGVIVRHGPGTNPCAQERMTATAQCPALGPLRFTGPIETPYDDLRSVDQPNSENLFL